MNDQSQPNQPQPGQAPLLSPQPNPATNSDNSEQASVTSAPEARHELQQAIQGSNQTLAVATTTFTLFPDTVVVDRTKITVTKRQFWRMSENMSIRIEDILNATATVGPLFGSLKITSRVMTTDKPYTIQRFWRHDAIRMKRILQGYVIAMQREIDCSALPTAELAHLLDQLGEDDHS